MKSILMLCFVGIVAAAVAVEDDDPILTLESKVEHDGKFHYHFETGKGAAVTQDGYLKNVDSEHDGESVEGKFSYVGDDGQEYAITYTADENGYQPHGDSIPTPPPIPEAIQRALKYIAEHPHADTEKPKP